MQPGKGFLLACIFFLLNGCANVYKPTSSTPALIQIPNVENSGGVADSFDLAAVDGETISVPAAGADFWRVDPGLRKLTLVYQDNGAFQRKFMAPAAVVFARLQSGGRYKLVCESTDGRLKGYVREAGTNRIVSDVAEVTPLPKPEPAAESVPLAIPARH